jgi:hypothetical protein
VFGSAHRRNALTRLLLLNYFFEPDHAGDIVR